MAKYNQESKDQLQNLFNHFADQIPDEKDINFVCVTINEWLDTIIESAKDHSVYFDPQVLKQSLDLDKVDNR